MKKMNVKVKNIIISVIINAYHLVSDMLLLFIARRLKKTDNGNEPLISIIIATYNRAPILVNRTIPSILNQTYKNFEIVVVGDNCIDNTPELIKSITDARLKFYDLDKRGNYPKGIKDRWFVQGTKPRNTGMRIAKGDWFVFISDDDILLPDHLEKLLNAALAHNVEFISASYETIKNGQKVIVNPSEFSVFGKNAYIGGMQTWMYKSYLKCFKWNIHSWRKSWNRPVDYDLQLRFLRSGVVMGHIEDVVYFNPAVEGTNTTGYEAALLADKD
jgi:glycosyltransferase involved in cell wall biosynthesis